MSWKDTANTLSACFSWKSSQTVRIGFWAQDTLNPVVRAASVLKPPGLEPYESMPIGVSCPNGPWPTLYVQSGNLFQAQGKPCETVSYTHQRLQKSKNSMQNPSASCPNTLGFTKGQQPLVVSFMVSVMGDGRQRCIFMQQPGEWPVKQSLREQTRTCGKRGEERGEEKKNRTWVTVWQLQEDARGIRPSNQNSSAHGILISSVPPHISHNHTQGWTFSRFEKELRT